MRILADPIVMRMVLLAVIGVIAFAVGVAAIRVVRKKLVE